MSLVPPSNVSAVPNNGQNKRSRTGRAVLSTESSRPTSTPAPKPPVVKTPLVIALELGTTYVATLHEEAQPFLRLCVEQTLSSFATYYWKQKKYTEMVENPNHVPSSCKIGLTLNSVSEVRESEDFITLNALLDAEIFKTQRTFADFALRAFNMTQRAHLQRFRKKFATLLPAAARIFGAELGLLSYGEHQAVVDLLARHCDNVLSPLNITLIDFLVLYRDANELARIPNPTVLNNIHDVIDAVNGPRPGEDPSHHQQAENLRAASDAQAFQQANSPDQEQAAAAAAATAAAAAAAAVAAAAGPVAVAVNADAASYAE